jgi:class 3 adenylate cyclase
MDIAAWLGSLGLERYVEPFLAHEIDWEVLPELSEADLESLGLPLGPRKKLLRAIAELRERASAPREAASAPGRRAGGAERRQLTLLFCDLVDSTALSARLDPEDMGTLIRAFQTGLSGVVARFEGRVAKFMGDGAMVYFGYPVAHEDDAERAVRAGLGIVEAMRKLKRERGLDLKVRIGIATGAVVVGELVGEGAAQEQAVVGDAPNLAARLQGLALPNTVVIAASTRQLLGGLFELEALGAQTIKGFAEPVPVWSVLREARRASRFEAIHAERVTPLVGREEESGLLFDRWRRALEGEGQVVLLSGEAGIGKSRILQSLRDALRAGDHRALYYQCSPHHANNPLYPVIGQIWHAAGFVSGEPASARLAKLEAMIAAAGQDAAELGPYLARLLSIPAEDRYRPLEASPEAIRERSIAALIQLLAGLARQSPILLMVEDAHWMDPTTLELISQTIDRLRRWRVLMIVTFRPHFTAPWGDRPHVTALTINRLGRRESAALVERVTGGKPLPAEVVEQIIEKTDGVPLFLEELTKTVLESGALREEDGAYVLASGPAMLAIPSTLQASLMARLDRLAHIKETAQLASVIGREFSYRLIEAVSPLGPAALQDSLEQLVAAELIHVRGAPPEAHYVFKHALVQDIAYSTLLRARRHEIHAAIARALSERFADQVGSAPEVIAHHYSAAGLAEPAVRHWIAAAELALSRSANIEAGRYAAAGLGLVDQLADGPERRRLELALQIFRGNAAIPAKGYTAPEVLEAYSAAKRILDGGIGSDPQRFAVLYGLWLRSVTNARIEATLALAEEYAAVADRQEDPAYRLIAHRLVGSALVLAGRHAEGLAWLDRAQQYSDPARQKPLCYRFGQDIGLAVLCYRVWALWFLGQHDRAQAAALALVAEGRKHEHAQTVSFCNFYGAVLFALFDRDDAAFERHSAELLNHASEHRLGQGIALGTLYTALVLARREPSPQHFDAVRGALARMAAANFFIWTEIHQALFARVLLQAGDRAGAAAALAAAFANVERLGHRFWLPELHRLEAELAAAEGAHDRAEAALRRAIEIAGMQGARLLELRAAADLVQLLRRQARGGEAEPLLAAMIARLAGAERSPDLAAARAVLGGGAAVLRPAQGGGG